jgi:hypothetical protein
MKLEQACTACSTDRVITHTNRKGNDYHLHSGTRKNGATHFYFSRKPKAESVLNELPAGYEIYEKPTSAQVFLRKSVPSNITDDEDAAASEAIRIHSHLPDYAIMSVRARDAITIYATERVQDFPVENHAPKMPASDPSIVPMPESFGGREGMLAFEEQLASQLGALQGELLAGFGIDPTMRAQSLQEKLTRLDDFTAYLRFELSDPKTSSERSFSASRFHFSREKWFHLSSGKLEDLLSRYISHIGKESFYELV